MVDIHGLGLSDGLGKRSVTSLECQIRNYYRHIQKGNRLRADLEAALSELAILDRKAVKQLRKKDYQTALAGLPIEERILAALPVVLNDSPGPLVVTDSHLMFVSSTTGNHLVDRLSHVQGTRFVHIGRGVGRRKKFELTINIGDNEVVFGVTGHDRTLAWFTHAIEVGQEPAGEPDTVVSPPPSTDEG